MTQHSTPVFETLTHLGDISIATFFKEYWQKKPLLIRNAFADFISPISADEIAGLTLEDDVVSRLVVETVDTNTWAQQHGPLEEKLYTELPETNWSILVQHADSLDPDVNALLNAFRFIPNWRLDDIMVSYATDQGGVGPHFDYFDVFLLQGEGQRRWRTGQHCDGTSLLIPDQPMKLLQEFNTVDDWIVGPGDLLYIPAQCAHWGQAVGESITYSIGFRAPSHADFLLDFTQELAATCTEDQRYRDPNIVEQQNAGELSTRAIDTFKHILDNYAKDSDTLIKWIGEYSTQLKQPIDNTLDTASHEELLSNTPCKIHPFCRIAYHDNRVHAACFINGQSWQCSLPLAQQLSGFLPIQYSSFEPLDQEFLLALQSQGLLVVE